MTKMTLFPDDPTDILRQILSLQDDGDDADTGFRRFTGHTPPQTRGRVFGGQVLAQSLIAASSTVEHDRDVHSLHCYFIRPGDALEPITFEVEYPRDGRSFSVRRVQAKQHGKVILSLSCSFQISAQGVEHGVTMPEDIPGPEALPTAADLLAHIDVPIAQEFALGRPFDIRHVTSPLYLQPDTNQRAINTVWMRTFSQIESPTTVSDFNAQAAALAYASDYTLLESILRRHGMAWIHRGISVASLDHSMWFHRPAQVDQWLLYTQESPSAQSARGLSSGHIFTRGGELLATVAQEGLLRIPEYDDTED